VANVYEAFSFGDRTVTGKVLADLTIDFCKTLAGVDVSQTDMTLVELGVGKYVVMNPNITERTIISGYVTGDATKSFSVMMDPVDGNIALEDTVQTLVSGGVAVDLTPVTDSLDEMKGVGFNTGSDSLKSIADAL
jgi:hypothetical protein